MKQRGVHTLRDLKHLIRFEELLRAANSYLDDALRQTEEAVAASLEKVRVARAQFRAAAAPEQPEGTADVTLQDVEDSEFING